MGVRGKTMKDVWQIAKPFKLEGALDSMKCPFLICHGGHDVLGVQTVGIVHDYAKRVEVDVTLRLVTEEETGADHCQHDNPTIGQEIMLDWLADRFGIDQRTLRNAQPL
jgi:pimeloyl-ACP methyl ester carboxylesterase